MTLTSKHVKVMLALLGAMYAVTLVPASVRPSWTKSPFQKADQQITVNAVTPDGTLPPDVGATLKKACKAPLMLRPFMGSAKHVRVIVVWGKTPVTVSDYSCKRYSS